MANSHLNRLHIGIERRSEQNLCSEGEEQSVPENDQIGQKREETSFRFTNIEIQRSCNGGGDVVKEKSEAYLAKLE